MNYFQIGGLYTDIVRSLRQSEQFRQAVALAEDLSMQDNAAMLSDYSLTLDRQATNSSIKLAARLVEARLNSVVNYFEHEAVRRQLGQKSALLDIAQQDAELGTYLALRFAMLHHLYQQQIELHLPVITAFDARNAQERELRFHQAKEEFSRTLYLLLKQDES